MPVLHHLFFGPERSEMWSQFAASLAAGDVVVLLDDAARVAALIGPLVFTHGVQILIPEVAMESLNNQSWPAGVARISESDWWSLIETMTLLEWN